MSATTVTRLDPPLHLQTKRGPMLTHFMVWLGVEMEVHWMGFLDNGQCWCVRNSEVRAGKNFTMGRPDPENPATHSNVASAEKAETIDARAIRFITMYGSTIIPKEKFTCSRCRNECNDSAHLINHVLEKMCTPCWYYLRKPAERIANGK